MIVERTFLLSFFERFDNDESFLGSIYGRVVSGSNVKYIYLGLSNEKMYIAESTDDSKDHIIREKTYSEIIHDLDLKKKITNILFMDSLSSMKLCIYLIPKVERHFLIISKNILMKEVALGL